MHSPLRSVFGICSHCSSACQLEYEVTVASIAGVKPHNQALPCETGLSAFNFANSEDYSEASKQAQISQYTHALLNSDAITFNSRITNEEAQLLQRLHEALNLKLVNEEARHYQRFMQAFHSQCHKHFDAGTIEKLEAAKTVMVLGSDIATDNPRVFKALQTASERNQASIAYLHPIDDANVHPFCSSLMRYEVGCEEGVIALLASFLISDKEGLQKSEAEALEALDIGYLSGECNISEEEIQDFFSLQSGNSSPKMLLLGSDLFAHEQAVNIAHYAALIEKYTDYEILFIPQEVNTIGVASLCELSPQNVKDRSVGYDCIADIKMSVVPSEAVSTQVCMPPFNQRSGTVVSIDKTICKSEAVLPFNGVTLLDIVISLGVSLEGIDLVNDKTIFDETRTAFTLNNETQCVAAVEDLPEFNGLTVYNTNPIVQFNTVTATLLEGMQDLRVSKQFATAAKVSDKSRVTFTIDNHDVERQVRIDTALKGMVALNPVYDDEVAQCANSYRYQQINIEKVS